MAEFESISEYLEIQEEILLVKDRIKDEIRDDLSFKDQEKLASQVSLKGKPLIELAGLPEIHKENLLKSFRTIASTIEKKIHSNSDLSRIENLFREKSIDLEKVFKDFKGGKLEYLGAISESHNIKLELLTFTLYTLLQAYLQLLSKELSGKIDLDLWYRGECFICGTKSKLGRLRKKDSALFLWCNLCGAEWRFMRAKCLYCGIEDPNKFKFFTLKNEDRFRVYTCDNCKWYFKVVDERKLIPLSYNTYIILTSHLDQLALEKGYK